MPVEKTEKKVDGQKSEKKTKKCYKCKKEQSIENFRQYKSGKNEGLYYSYCDNCKNERNKLQWTIHWYKTYLRIHTRCTCKKHKRYESYKKLKFEITPSQLKEIWFRDKAYNLKKPSIDRIDNTKGYVFNNLQYIEHSDNVKKYWYHDRFLKNKERKT